MLAQATGNEPWTKIPNAIYISKFPSTKLYHNINPIYSNLSPIFNKSGIFV